MVWSTISNYYLRQQQFVYCPPKTNIIFDTKKEKCYYCKDNAKTLKYIDDQYKYQYTMIYIIDAT